MVLVRRLVLGQGRAQLLDRDQMVREPAARCAKANRSCAPQRNSCQGRIAHVSSTNAAEFEFQNFRKVQARAVA